DRDVAGLNASAVMLDNQAAAYAAVNHLIELGHERVGMIAGRPPLSSTTERQAGYRRALHDAGVAIDETLVVTGGSTIDGGPPALGRRSRVAPVPRRRPGALELAGWPAERRRRRTQGYVAHRAGAAAPARRR